MNGEAQLPQKRRPAFHGNAETLFGIRTVNLLFTLMTLGVYSFWGKTESLAKLGFDTASIFSRIPSSRSASGSWKKSCPFIRLIHREP